MGDFTHLFGGVSGANGACKHALSGGWSEGLGHGRDPAEIVGVGRGLDPDDRGDVIGVQGADRDLPGEGGAGFQGERMLFLVQERASQTQALWTAAYRLARGSGKHVAQQCASGRLAFDRAAPG